MNNLELIITACLFGLFGWMSAVECGVSFLRLLPSSTFTKQGLRLFSPAWELVHLYVLLGGVTFLSQSTRPHTAVFERITASVIVGIAVVFLHVILLIGLRYAKKRTGLTWLNLLFSATSFAVPLSLGSSGIKLLTGQYFWQTLSGWLMILCMALGLVAMALSFVYFVVGQTPHDRLHQVSRWLNVGFGASVVLIFELVVLRQLDRLQVGPTNLLVALAGFIVVLQTGLWFGARERYMWWYLSVFGALTPLLLALANRPYIYYPILRANDTHSQFFVFVSTFVFLVGLAGVTVLAVLFNRRKKADR